MATLLQILGLTPQVVTETLWAIQMTGVKVRRLRLFTTHKGLEIARKTLLGPRGALSSYVKEYSAPKSLLNPIITLVKHENEEMADIRNSAQLSSMADQIMEIIREETSRDNARLFCSVAGGRKTMDVLAAFAMQIYGKSDDILCHVLVKSEMENRADFFYPKPGISAPDGIELVSIPYLKLRDSFKPRSSKAMGFAGLVEHLQKSLEMASGGRELELNLNEMRLTVGNEVVRLSPRLMSFFLFFVLRKLDHCSVERKECPAGCTQCFIALEMEKLESPVFEELLGAIRKVDNTRKVGKQPVLFNQAGLDSVIRANISRINHIIALAWGDRSVTHYGIQATGKRPNTFYGLSINKTLLHIRGIP